MTKKFLVLGLILALVAAGCSRNTPVTTAAGTLAPTETVPTPTSTAMPGKVLLVTDSRFTGDLAGIEKIVTDKARSAGLVYEKRDSLQPADISSEWKLVLFTVKPDNLTDFLSQAPGTFFVVITSESIQPAANLSVVHTDPVKLAFLAGYITELIAEDWRGAGLLPSDASTSNDVKQAFVNGGQYWCGICSPQHPPYIRFPVYAEQSSGADWTAWQAAVDPLIQNRLSVIYVSQQAAKPELMSYLADKGIKMLGETTPTQAILGNWVATLGWNIPDMISNHWSDFLSGQPGQVYETGISITNVSAEWLSTGRVRLVEETAGKLQDGMVSPLPVP